MCISNEALFHENLTTEFWTMALQQTGSQTDKGNLRTNKHVYQND